MANFRKITKRSIKLPEDVETAFDGCQWLDDAKRGKRWRRS